MHRAWVELARATAADGCAVGRAIGVLALAIVAAGCSNKLAGDLTIDGEPFELKSCRSGAVYGFVGVELVGKTGGRLRVAHAPTGEAVAFFLPPDAASGVEIGACGTLTVSNQNSTINDVKNVEGQGTLDCDGGGHTVKGSFSFENCH